MTAPLETRDPAGQLPVSVKPAPVVSDQSDKASLWSLALPVAVAVLLTSFVGLFVTIGADSRWLAALGRIVVTHGAIPRGVPFAAEPTAHWSNTLVLAELCFHGLEAALGNRGLALANLVCVTAGLSILAYDARAGGAQGGKLAAGLILVTVGAFPSLAVARIQMFSLVLFPALIGLLRAEARRPSARIWLALPLLALWSNLHGAALSGLAVLYAYLALSRFRNDRLTALGVALGALVALCLTPAGIDSASYYHGLVTNVAAEQGVGQWAPLGSSPFDWVMILAALVLAWGLRSQRPRLWEIAVLIGLAALTVKAGRDGVWLLFFLITPASRGGRARKRWEPLSPALLIVGLILIVVDIAHPPHPSGISSRMVDQAVRTARGAPILADGLPAEQVALAGGKIWAGNPLDAFSHKVQAEYVDFIQGRGPALSAPNIRFVLVSRGSGAASLVAADHQFAIIACDSTAVLYRRSS